MPSLRLLALCLLPILLACSSSTPKSGSGTAGANAGIAGSPTSGAGGTSAASAGAGGSGVPVGGTGTGGSTPLDPTAGGGGAPVGTAGSGGDSAASISCGYQNQGHVLNVTPDISLCIPPQTCLPETCPPTLGTCVNDQCVFKAGYRGLETLPEAWATHYCDLAAGTCQGVHQFEPVLTTAQKLAAKSTLPLCGASAAGSKCVGIVASPPMMVGNREKYKEAWGLGLSEASGLCYEVTGPGGSALLALTDRCGGFCKCPSAGATEFNECGLCKEAADLTPLCECRGPDSCAAGQLCDWCAANNHPHFDLDQDAFAHVCGDQAFKGSCLLSKAKFVPCLEPRPDWPPPL
jgi:hypothetical protein